MSPRRLPVVRPALAAVAALPSLLSVRQARRAMGVGRPRRDYTRSPQYRDGIFHNRLPATLIEEGSRRSMARDWATKGRRGKPRGPVRVETHALPAEAGELAATWLGHATVLLEIEGRRVLTDPVWSERVSPSTAVGPRRMHRVPMALEDLPRIDVVLVSHDHYDHLDTATIDALARTQPDAVFVVPLGIGGHLAQWGVPAERVVELDWDESTQVAGLTLTCTEARHFSGRSLVNNRTLWSSWVVAGERRRVFFGGDTGYTPGFAEIGERLGPFELTVLPIGAYDARWRDVHVDPAEAVRMHRDVRGGVLLPIHWATFDLAFHDWADPVEWLVREAAEHDVDLALPAPGGRVALDDASAERPVADWWSASV